MKLTSFLPVILYKNQLLLDNSLKLSPPHLLIQSVSEMENKIIINGIHTQHFKHNTLIYQKNSLQLLNQFEWNDTTVGNIIIKDECIRFNVLGNYTKINLETFGWEVDSLLLEKDDFITCLEYNSELKLIILMTFQNHLFMIDKHNKIYKFLNVISFTDAKYPMKIKLYYENITGPLSLVVQFNEGHFLYLKFIIYKDFQLLENYIIKIPTKSENVLDFVLVNYVYLHFLIGSKTAKKCILQYNMKTKENSIKFVSNHFIKMVYNNGILYLYDIHNYVWKKITL
jgi:hypothetical protein